MPVTLSEPHTTIEVDQLFDEAGAAAMVELCERFGRYGMYSQEHVDSPHRRRPLAAPRRAVELPAHRRPHAATRARRTCAPSAPAPTTSARSTPTAHEALHRRHRAVPPPRGLRRGRRGRSSRPAGHRAGHRLRQPDGPGPGAGRAHRRARVPRLQPQGACRSGCSSPCTTRAVRGPPHADRHRRVVVPRLRRRRVRLLARRRRRPGAAAHRSRYNTAVVLDADSVFHGVDRIAVASCRRWRRCAPACASSPPAADEWVVRDGDDDGRRRTPGTSCASPCRGRPTASPTSTSSATWREHADDLTLDVVVDRLVADLRERERDRRTTVPPDPTLALLIIDTYIRFPRPAG